MPLPPIHGLIGLLPYFRNRKLDPLALVVGATFVDLESLVYIVLGNPLDHQFFHGYLLVFTVYTILVGLFVYFMERGFERKIWSIYTALRFNPTQVKYAPVTIYLCCFAGGLSHLLFDMWTHRSLPYIIYPLTYGNPFYIGQYTGIIELTAIGLALVTIYLWWKTKSRPQSSK